MPSRKNCSHKNCTRNNCGHKKMRGGSYTSASTYGGYVNGSPATQFARTFDSNGQYASRAGAEYVGAQGQGGQIHNMPTQQNLSLIQSAGRRRKHRKSRRSRRGGFFGQVINQAIVPFGLLGLQQTYRKKSRVGRKSRKHRH